MGKHPSSTCWSHKQQTTERIIQVFSFIRVGPPTNCRELSGQIGPPPIWRLLRAHTEVPSRRHDSWERRRIATCSWKRRLGGYDTPDHTSDCNLGFRNQLRREPFLPNPYCSFFSGFLVGDLLSPYVPSRKAHLVKEQRMEILVKK